MTSTKLQSEQEKNRKRAKDTENSENTDNTEEGIAQILEAGRSLNTEGVQEWIKTREQKYVKQLITWKSERVGERTVRGFEKHDLKHSEDFVENIGEAYSSIVKGYSETGGRDTDGYAAAEHHIGALKIHDIIEDGLEEVEECYTETLPPRIRADAIKEEENSTLKLHNSLWDDYVKHHFVEMAWNLGLSEDKSQRFGEENKEFYRRHTGVHEDSDEDWDRELDRGSQDKVMQQGAYEFYAIEAQKTLISGITERDRDEPKVEELALGFLEVVNSHDAHTLEDQLENMRRMKGYYRELLSDILALEA